ncbi:MAG: lamin tail domain-containing protein [Candidatus Delongbacteria bacterium]
MKKALWGGLMLILAARSFAGVFISEYIEGTATNKAIEIYNGTAASINMMDDYRLGLASNGGATATIYQFNKNVAPGDVFVVANSASNAAILAVADTLSNGFANWNGDDFVGLYQMVAGTPVLVDVIGVLGTDPGTSWTVAGDVAGSLNHTMNRKPTVSQPNSNWALSAGTNAGDSEWIINPVDTFTDLGTHFVDTGMPILGGLAFLPEFPTSSEAVTVSVNATDNVSLTSVNLVYSVDGGAAQTVAMTLGVAPAYSAVIPAQADLAEVDFHVEATDNESNTTVSGTLSYTVMDSFPCADISTIRANDANGSPLLLGAVRSLCGVVTMSNQLGAAGPIYITGDTGSMALYGAGFVTGVTIGDEVQATGTVGFYNGLTEMVTPTFLNVVGHPGEPTPVSTTLLALAADGESFEAQFVEVSGLSLVVGSVWPNAGSNGTVNVTDGSVEFALFIDRDTDIDGSVAPAGEFTVRAIIGQFDAVTPYFESYQLIPRSLADFIFTGNQPPSIGGVAHAPHVPTSTEPVTVTATVVDDVTVTSVSLFYQVNGGGYLSVPMSVVSGDLYGASLPAQADLAVVDYYVTATDDQAETSTGATYSYTVYDVFPCANIADIRVLDANGVPLMVNQRVFVCGTVTATNQFDATRGPVYITGPTGSMAVYGTAALPAGLQLGDDYQAIGIVKNYNGLIELDPSEYSEITGHSGLVAPLAVTLAQLIATPEAYEARLVEVTGLTLDPGAVWPAPGANATLTVWQGTDSYALQIDKDTDLDEGMAPAGEFTLRALVGQFDTATPFDSGYQLLPRFQADILTALAAPAVTIAVSGATATLSWAPVAGATDYVVYTSTDGYSGWDAGVATAGATSHTATVTGRAFFKVVATN